MELPSIYFSLPFKICNRFEPALRSNMPIRCSDFASDPFSSSDSTLRVMRSKLSFSFEESDVLTPRILLPAGNSLLFYYCGYGFEIIILFNFH